MNKLILAGLVSSLALLGGCSSNPFSKEQSRVDLMEQPDDIVVPDTPPKPVVQLPENIPEWYISLPEDSREKIYGSGAGLSSDLQFSIDKAMHQAKIVLGDKISSTVSAELKTYMTDNSSVSRGVTLEETQRVSKSGFKNIDVSAYEIVNKHVYRDNDKFRSFILLGLDITNKDERKQNDHVTTPVDIEAVRQAQDAARSSMDNL